MLTCSPAIGAWPRRHPSFALELVSASQQAADHSHFIGLNQDNILLASNGGELFLLAVLMLGIT
jgi:hypothetical protein